MSDRWIAVDWGTTNLRLWALEGSKVVGQATSDKGMGALTPEGFEPALLELAEPYLIAGAALPVWACGMVGARQGWREAPYASVPCAPVAGEAAVRVATKDPRVSVRILPGLSQTQPADVMRGEETQVAGFLARDPAFDGVICLPGTHCKWVHVSAGEVVSFRTFMTGEQYALLSGNSVLRHAIQNDESGAPEVFLAAVDRAMGHPQMVSADLFGIRAEALLAGLSPVDAAARLSGLLIGSELAGARPYWLGQRVALVGSGALIRRYDAALRSLGVMAELHSGADLVLAGLVAARSGGATV